MKQKSIVLKGRAAPKVDKDLLFKLAQTLLPVESIATIIGCSRDNLYKYYRETLDKGRELRKQTLSEAMWHKALVERDTKMQIWLSKQHLGYRDNYPDQPAQVQFSVTCIEVPR